MKYLRTAALTTTAMLATVLPVAAPSAWAEDRATFNAPRTVTQQPGHPLVLFPRRQGTVVAYCPQGTKPTGGGATVETDPVSAVYLTESMPVDGNRWRVRVYNSSDEVHTVHPRVVCTTDPTITYQAGPDQPIQPGESAEYSTADCGSQYTVGGGGQAGSMTFLSMLDVPGTPMARRWNARAKYTVYDPDAPLSYVRAHVSCSDSQPAYGFSRVLKLAPGAVGTVRAECPAGRVPTGGGASGSPVVLFNESGPTDTGWEVRATNTDFDAERNLFATVMCTAP
ncbi:hypothetical protein [Streptomyces sp. NPDC048603]|uniref:hypothetical protein n=1 Tax=Streptomyces sp. NPDC048603 TaxID=3365577 RepID=UPI003718AB55